MKTLEEFDWSFNPQIPKALILDLATTRFVREHGGLLLLGLGRPLGIVGVIITSQATVDGLSEQMDEVVSDVAAGTAFLEIIAGDIGKAQDMIQLSNGQ